MSRRITTHALAGLAAVAALTAGCGRATPSGAPTSPTPSPTPSPAASSPQDGEHFVPGDDRRGVVYYLVDGPRSLLLAPEYHRAATTLLAAVNELTDGIPHDPDHERPFPEGSRAIGAEVDPAGIATIDWNAAVLVAPGRGAEGESRAIQAAVYTATEFPGVQRVRFTVEGKDRGTASNGRTIEDWWGHVGLSAQPFAREDALDVLEPITIWTPPDSIQVGFRVVARGEASVFEANVLIRLVNEEGRVVVRRAVTATEGAPGRGTWDIDILLDERTLGGPAPGTLERWRLEAVDVSAMDGSDDFVEDRVLIVGPTD